MQLRECRAHTCTVYEIYSKIYTCLTKIEIISIGVTLAHHSVCNIALTIEKSYHVTNLVIFKLELQFNHLFTLKNVHLTIGILFECNQALQ